MSSTEQHTILDAELGEIASSTEAGVVAELAARAVEVQTIDGYDHLRAVVNGDGLELTSLEQYADAPLRTRGTARLRTAQAFVDYVKGHAHPEGHLWGDTTVWVDRGDPGTVPAVQAVLNDHGDPDVGSPAWGDHRAVLALQFHPDWQQWVQQSRRMASQVDFAEFLEEHAHTLVEPVASVALEIATSLRVTKGVEFEEATRLDNGEQRLKYKETVKAKAGQTGQLDVPESFSLGLQVFRGSARYTITARLRYRLVGNDLTIGLWLDRPDRVLDAAVDDLILKVTEDLADTPVKLYEGTPITAGER